ncbi:MAG: glycosyltransferase [Phormidesmis sp.]
MVAKSHTVLPQIDDVNELLARLLANSCLFDTYRSAAKAYIDRKDFDAALEVYKESVIQFPDSAEAYRELGAVQERLKIFEGEIESYRKALELDVAQPFWLYMTLARLLAEHGQAVEAINLYRQGFKLYPQEPDGLSYACLARLLSAEGDVDAALKNYELAFEHQPDLDWVEFCIETLHYNQGVTSLLGGQLSLAGDHFQKVNQVKPSWEIPVWFKKDEMTWPRFQFDWIDQFDALKPQNVSWPKISIVTPSFNQGHFIEETILSILNQNYENVEYIVVDGGSTDETLSVLERYQNQISIMLVEPDSGQSSAINKGFRLASGELFGWLNSDDMLAPGALHFVAMAYLKSKRDVIAGICIAHRNCNIEMLRKPNMDQGFLVTSDLVSMSKWEDGNFFFQPEMFFSRKIWEKSGAALSEDLHYAMDHELWLRLAQSDASVEIVDWPIGLFRKHIQQKTASMQASLKELEGIMEKYQSLESDSSENMFLDSSATDQRTIDKPSMEAGLSEVESFFKEERWQDMFQACREFILAHPESADGYRWQGIAQEKLSDFEGQLVSYRKTIDLIPHQSDWVYIVTANLLIEKEQWADAIQVLQVGLNYCPDSADMHRLLGLCHEKIGDTDAQLDSYRQALSLDDDQPPWVYAVTINLLRTKQHLEEAISLGALAKEHFSELSQSHAGICFELAKSYSDLGELQSAIDTYSLAFQLDNSLLEAKEAMRYALLAYNFQESSLTTQFSSSELSVESSNSRFDPTQELNELKKEQALLSDLVRNPDGDKSEFLLFQLHQTQSRLEKCLKELKIQSDIIENHKLSVLDSSQPYSHSQNSDFPPFRKPNVKKYLHRPHVSKLKGFPPDLVLPRLRGENNDYTFIEKAVENFLYERNSYELFVSVVLPAHSNATFVKKTLAAITKQTYSNHLLEVILVVGRDVSFDDIGLEKYLQILDLTVVQVESVSSIGCLFNEGIRKAKYDYVITLDRDILPTCQLVENYMKRFHVNDNCLLLGERKFLNVEDISEEKILRHGSEGLLNKLERIDFSRSDWGRERDEKFIAAYEKVNGNLKKDRYPFRLLSSANAAYPMRLLKSSGLFDEDFLHCGFQDKEIGYRIFNSGAYIIPVQNSLGIHQDITVDRMDNFPVADPKKNEALFEEKCPVGWYRKHKKNYLYQVPKVSIYIPSYNNAAYIKEAVDSALNQTYTDLEICICDDGSTDNTLEVLETYFSDNPRVSWMSQENGGIGTASNSAVRMCRGMYIGQLDSDDLLKPNAVATLVSYLEDNNIGCVYSSCERIDADGNYLMDEYSYPKFSREKMLLTSIAHHFRMFRRRDWLRTESFNEELLNAVDYDMFLKLSEVCTFHHIEETLYARRWHGKNTSFVNEGKQSSNTPVVITYSLERMGLTDDWEVYVPDQERPRELAFRRKIHIPNLFFFPDYRKSNTYQDLLYSPVSEECALYSGDIDSALQAVNDGMENVIFHLHWTNYLLGKAESEEIAERLKNVFFQRIFAFLEKRGKVIWTIHNVMPHNCQYVKQEVQLRQMLATLSSIIHVHSESSIAEIESFLPASTGKIVVAHHGHYIGIDENIITREQARQRYDFSTEETVFLFLGQIRAYKGVEELVRAFSAVVSTHENARLLIAGMPKESFSIEEICSDSQVLSNVVYEPRYIERNELQWFYNCSDFVVLPYRKILTSGSLIHAMSFSRPVIAPDLGMIKDLVDDNHNGFLYQPNNIDALINAMGRACETSESQRQQFFKKAFESVSVLDWKSVFSRILARVNMH